QADSLQESFARVGDAAPVRVADLHGEQVAGVIALEFDVVEPEVERARSGEEVALPPAVAEGGHGDELPGGVAEGDLAALGDVAVPADALTGAAADRDAAAGGGGEHHGAGDGDLLGLGRPLVVGEGDAGGEGGAGE